MTDREKIRAYVKRLQKPEGYGDYWKGYDSALNDILSFIDSLQEEPVSKVWHDASERPNYNVGKTVIVGYNNDDDLYDECNNVAYYINLSFFVSRKDLNTKVVRWAYLKDLI